MNSTCEPVPQRVRVTPYTAYRDSGVEWLGEVPEHWQVGRASSRLRVRNRPIHPREMSQSEIFHYSIPNVQEHGGGGREKTASVESGKILVDRELLLVSKLNPRKGTIALAFPHPTLMTIASGEFVAMEPGACVGAFARYLYVSESVRLELSSRVNSATKSHQRCTPEDIAKLRVPWPPTDEQTAIARFLDDADRRIRRCIWAKERLIELLEEERRATIHEAVTGRIDVRSGHPYPAYKDSGVDWLGKVPEHWSVVPLKRMGWFRSGSGFPISAQGNRHGEILFAKVSDMNRSGNSRAIIRAANSVSREIARGLGAHIFPPHTIVFPKVGGALLTNKRRVLVRETCIDNNLMGCVVTNAQPAFAFRLLRWLDLGAMAKPGPIPAIGERGRRDSCSTPRSPRADRHCSLH